MYGTGSKLNGWSLILGVVCTAAVLAAALAIPLYIESYSARCHAFWSIDAHAVADHVHSSPVHFWCKLLTDWYVNHKETLLVI